ncbi:MAG: alpha-glucosidase/alpha-galactosidase [Anaerolineae bacterium]|nr:alpha-glucosidase/alpha-galactosidase [Anaerolineae bacterium]MDW8100904.1 alpha-glucosidase/alpha-galactosidase [Anaerolineae bacterium]
MRATKITLIGAGSTSFGLSTLQDIFAYADALQGSTIVLADVNAESLDLMTRVAQGMNAEANAGLTFEGTTDLRAALDGAEFVIVSVAVDRIETWKKDWEIPLKYGVKHVLGENGGPGGLSHTLRSVRLMLEVADVIEEVAPDALVLNFTNPMSRVCLALKRATSLQCVGLCHQISAGYLIVGQVLGLIEKPRSWDEARAQVEMLQQRLDIKAAGLNHFTFIYDLRDNETGEDLYPEFKERLAMMPPDFEPLSRRLFEAFGLFPATGDGHAGEYVSFAWETSDLKGYDFDGWMRHGEEVKAKLRRAVMGEGSFREFLGRTSGERAIPIIDAVLHNKNQYEQALNIPNRGCIPGLPDWAIVEVPGVVSGAGINGLQVPELPPGITALLAQQVAIQDLAVEAAIHGDRQAALQALLLDPVVSSYEAAVKMLDELLTVHAPYLPQFRPWANRVAV